MVGSEIFFLEKNKWACLFIREVRVGMTDDKRFNEKDISAFL